MVIRPAPYQAFVTAACLFRTVADVTVCAQWLVDGAGRERGGRRMPTNDELQDELAELREEMRQLRATFAANQAPKGEAEPRLLSRRNLLRAAPVAAVGGAIAAMSATPAAAATGDPVLLGKTNDAGVGKTTVISGGNEVLNPTGPPPPTTSNDPAALVVEGGFATDWLSAAGLTMNVANDQGASLLVAPQNNSPGQSVSLVAAFKAPLSNYPHENDTSDGVAINCIGATALRITAPDGSHESGLSTSTGVAVTVGAGVGVTATASDGTDGQGNPFNGVALSGSATTGAGVHAEATEGHAIEAVTTSSTTTSDAVTIAYAGKSRALYAESSATTNINGTITGVNAGNGIGVWGEQRGTGAGLGLVGVAGKAGRGAQLTGGAAQLRMVPATAATHPTTGKAGDFFVDASNRLWFCQKASSRSTTATWKQLA